MKFTGSVIVGLCFLVCEVTAFSTVTSLQNSYENCANAMIYAAEKDTQTQAFGAGFEDARKADAEAKMKCDKMEAKGRAVESFLHLQ